MTRIAISGHRGLGPEVGRFVDEQIRHLLASVAQPGELVGLSCLADGADQIFAEAVLDAGGVLDVVIPAITYRDGMPEEARAGYDALLARARTVHHLDHMESTPEAHMHASTEMLNLADQLVAVWDGQPARAYGGTADVVDHAKTLGIPITVIWPAGATRS